MENSRLRILAWTMASLGWAMSAQSQSVTLTAAGDLGADCGNNFGNAPATAALVDNIPGTVAMLGDMSLPWTTDSNVAHCFDATWGRFRNRTRPAIGNHESDTPGAAAYFSYWGPAAGDPPGGYYSYDYGSWHILVLNSNCTSTACQTGSPQETWVRNDLAAHPALCTLAYWHAPYYTSNNTSRTAMNDIWQDLYNAHAELVISGHIHAYERFAPQDAAGNLDMKNGVVQFVVGTGGAILSPTPSSPLPNSVIRNYSTWGVLQLTLSAGSYSWQFIPMAGQAFTDSGSAACH